ncbi:MAG: hypothetical protein WBV82_12855 [Myxococcaceae bacterium]
MAEMETGYGTSGTGPEYQSRTRERLSQGRDKFSEYSGVARRKATEYADTKKSTLVTSLDRIAQTLEDAGRSDGGPERQLFQKAARYARQAKDAIDGRSSDELVNVAVRELRDRPAAIIAGMFVVGFFGARLLRT